MTLDEFRTKTDDMPGDTEIKISTDFAYTRYASLVDVIGPEQNIYGGPYPFILISAF